MSQPIDAAAVGDQDRRAIIIDKPQPADPQTLACPNCNDTTALVLIEQATIERTIYTARDVGTSLPELDVDDYDEAGILDPPPPVVTGVRCGHCRWGYKGDNALARLVRVR